MKCIINCPERSTGWIREFFPGYSPYLLRIGNKPYLEFLLDFCVLSGIHSVRIVSDNPDGEVETVLGNGDRWNLAVSYGAVAPDLPVSSVIERNAGFVGDDALLILSGLFWLKYDKRDFQAPACADREGIGEFLSECDGWFLRGSAYDHKAPLVSAADRELPFQIERLDSVKRFYRWNMALLYEFFDHYNLPGYGGDLGVNIGRNVIIPRSADVKTPTLLGDAIQLGHGTVVGPGAVVGDNSLIDNDATVVDTVVMGNSYVGCNLELYRKIIYQNIIIDPSTEVKLNIVDEFLLTPLVKSGQMLCPYKQRIAAVLLWLLQVIPVLLLRPFLVVESDEVECFMNQQRERKLKLRLYVRPAESVCGRYFRKLSLDRFHLLPMVWRGELRLVGSLIFEATPENARLLRQFPDYSPGIFSFSELLEHEKDPIQREMDELYYMYHTSFWLNLKILFKTLFRNLLKRA